MNQTIEEIDINGVKYVRKDNIAVIPYHEYDTDLRIVVLQRGWIYIGRFEKLSSGTCRLHNASNIRLWGTTKGLQELVHGPTSSTKLDKCDGVVEFDWLTVIHTIAVDAKKWSL